MQIREATLNDLEQIEQIYSHARSYMRLNGNMNQWIGGYPQRDLLESDIAQHHLFVVEENEELLAVFACIYGEDPTYKVIYDGAWPNDEPYAVIHRIAIKANKKGIATYCITHVLDKYRNVRIDTHKDNIPMQSLMKKLGFAYCGIIIIADGSPRLAYQKTI